MSTVGQGQYEYEVVERWGTLPTGWTFGAVSAVAVDSQSVRFDFIFASFHRLVEFFGRRIEREAAGRPVAGHLVGGAFTLAARPRHHRPDLRLFTERAERADDEEGMPDVVDLQPSSF